MVVSIGVVSVSATDIREETVTAEAVSPRIIHSYTKTVTKTYSSFYSIPTSISYEEYNSTLGVWFTGTLTLQSAKRDTSVSFERWIATYTGTLIGNI